MQREIMPHDILYMAAGNIESFGHCKREMRNRKGNFCMLGALQEAGVGARLIGYHENLERQPIIAQAMYALKKSIAQHQGYEYLDDYSRISIAGWNDSPATSKQQVLNLIRSTADYIKEHGAPEVPKPRSFKSLELSLTSFDLSKIKAGLYSVEVTISHNATVWFSDCSNASITYASKKLADALEDKPVKKPQPAYVQLADQAIAQAQASSKKGKGTCTSTPLTASSIDATYANYQNRNRSAPARSSMVHRNTPECVT